jgi:hypothetical protein
MPHACAILSGSVGTLETVTRMFLANIGEQEIESIYEVHPGDNFGGSQREGPFVFKAGDPYSLPVQSADHGGDRGRGADRVCLDGSARRGG